jgi:hypothetical protein
MPCGPTCGSTCHALSCRDTCHAGLPVYCRNPLCTAEAVQGSLWRCLPLHASHVLYLHASHACSLCIVLCMHPVCWSLSFLPSEASPYCPGLSSAFQDALRRAMADNPTLAKEFEGKLAKRVGGWCTTDVLLVHYCWGRVLLMEGAKFAKCVCSSSSSCLSAVGGNKERLLRPKCCWVGICKEDTVFRPAAHA